MGLLQILSDWGKRQKEKNRQIRLLETINWEFRDIAFRCTRGDVVKSSEYCAFLALLVNEEKVQIKKGSPLDNFDVGKLNHYVFNAAKSARMFHEALYSTAIVVCSGDELRASEFMGFVSFLFLMQKVQLIQKISEVNDGQQQCGGRIKQRDSHS